ncbi:MAG: alanyl-tRNA editing protein [Pseudomonadota bacterium]
MTEPLFRDDAYAEQCEATVTAFTESGAVILDRTVFYAAGGGQPGDTGTLRWEGGSLEIVDTRKHIGGIAHLPAVAEGEDLGALYAERLPRVGTTVTAEIDSARRLRHMRCHTALHLLSVVLPFPVTGGQIGAEKGRLDFDMPEAPGDKAALEAELKALIEADHPVTSEWITEEELLANPGLVKTMAVQPPMGEGRVRLVRIGAGETPVDLQPCGGTHVRSTAEIGPVSVGKVEKKGKQNRRVSLLIG